MLNVTLAAAQRHDVLTIFPLVTTKEAELPYTLLADALEAGTVEISEVGAGTVPRLRAVNTGDAAVLILDGEQLIGAKQNRMTNRSILLPAKSATEIPVSCMEQGRWHVETETMKPTSHHSPANVRRHARKAEAEYALMGMAPPPEALSHAQGQVWDEIAGHMRDLGVHSETGALDDLYGDRSAAIEEWATSFRCGEGQVGLLAFVADRPIGLDVIGGRRLYARLHERLLRGYIMDALTARRQGADAPAPAIYAAQRFLDRVRQAQRVDTDTVGRGVYRVLAGDVIGGELEDDGRLAHLCGFPSDDGGARRGDAGASAHAAPPVAPPSRRRRTR